MRHSRFAWRLLFLFAILQMTELFATLEMVEYLFEFIWLCLPATYKNQRFPRMRLWLHPTHAYRKWFQVSPKMRQFRPVIKNLNSTAKLFIHAKFALFNGIIKSWNYKSKRGNLNFVYKFWAPRRKWCAHFSQGSGGRVIKKARW